VPQSSIWGGYPWDREKTQRDRDKRVSKKEEKKKEGKGRNGRGTRFYIGTSLPNSSAVDTHQIGIINLP